MGVGENLKAARMAAGIRQADLAASVGVRQKDVSRWETGAVMPSAEMLGKICRALGASADAILELDRD